MVGKKSVKLGLFLALALIIIFSFLVSAETEGCYIYSQGSEDLYCRSGVLESAAQTDCNKYSDCRMSQFFVPNADCNSFEECAEVTCNVDCQLHALGKCLLLGDGTGQALAEDQISAWCNPGCCKVQGTNLCSYGYILYNCQEQAKLRLGTNYDPLKVFFNNDIGMNQQTCLAQICEVNLASATLKGYVLNSQNQIINNAYLEIAGTRYSTTNGHFEIALNPGTYPLIIGAERYNPFSASFFLTSGETKEINYTLISTGGITVSGLVLGENSIPLISATVSWEGPTNGHVFTDNSGKYLISGLTSGNYTFKANMIGYQSQEQKKELGSDLNLIFNLQKIVQVGIYGITSISNGETILPQYGIKIYVDGIFKAYSRYPDGSYAISLVPNQEYAITASYQDYEAEPIKITPPQELNIVLAKYLGECGTPETLKNVALLTVYNVPGENALKLEWEKPCPEVIGYEIIRHERENIITLTPEPTARSMIDYDVEWGKDYSYEIIARYQNGISPAAAASEIINVGNKICEGRYHPELDQWDTFCLAEDLSTSELERKNVWTCNDLNQLEISKPCAELDQSGEDYYCARISVSQATCKNAGSCDNLLYSNPFGLYYTKDTCYGNENQNYCYFDFTSTIVNQCKKCTELQSCFEYNSRDACLSNNCLGSNCIWIDSAANNQEPILNYGSILPGTASFTTSETGAGFCTDTKYEDDDRCSLCSKEGKLFDNFFCTAQICSGLGKCFAQISLASCQSCGDYPTTESNCYSYVSPLECVGYPQQKIISDDYGTITFSKDRCNWKRCSWNGAEEGFGEGTCFKDGDANNQDDCAEFSAGEAQLCKLDISAPKTILLAEAMPIISQAHPNLEFLGDDEFNLPESQRSRMKVLGYCLTSGAANAADSCTINQLEHSEVNYPGAKNKEMINLTILNSNFLREKINGQTYKLKYYSKDRYNNQEQVQQTFVFVDNVAPEFEIGNITTTLGEITDLTIFLQNLEDHAQCTFVLSQILPSGEKKTISISREEKQKSVNFTGLVGIRYDLNVTCEDESGNLGSKTTTYIFDQEKRIDIISPSGVLAQREIIFKIRTISPAQCSLYNSFSNEKITDFQTNEEAKEHETESISGFYEKNYAGDYKAVCHELYSDLSYEDYFNFRIDFTAPSVQIKLKEGTREVLPLGYGWKEYFIESVNVNFECISEGFSCDKIYYCLGSECEVISIGDYKEYKETAIITNSTKICYYPVDKGGNYPYAPTCGEILIEGYGITLEKPTLYYYQNEQWGISNRPVFDFQFFTKVPTEECRIDFTSNFDYDAVPLTKIKNPNEFGKYLFENFPESVFTTYSEEGGVKEVYVKCRNLEGEISPETKINLEYDPTAPHILDAYADPDLVLEGVTTDLYVNTDDKTVCKYSDNSESSGSSEYITMEYSFPGRGENILDLEHIDNFNINFISDNGKKDYSLNVQCANGAEDLSELNTIEFSVDYSAIGYISRIWPQGNYLNEMSVNLQADTSKNAFCQYRLNDSYVYFAEGEGAKEHQQSLGNLEEKEYLIPFKCVMGDHVVEDAFSFTVDLTPPTITEVEDGNFTCGSSEIAVMVYSEIDNIGGYYYEVYDLGEDKSIYPSIINISSSATRSSRINISSSLTSSNSPGILILNATISELPIKLPTRELIEGHKYQVKVQAVDTAGNWGILKASNGFWVVASNYSTCQEKDPPHIETKVIQNCTATWVEMRVSDVNSLLQVKYGDNLNSDSCQTNKSYNGQSLQFKRKTWLCYFAEDVINNSQKNSLLIPFDDKDGDGIADIIIGNQSCDLCPNTPSGKIVDIKGCSSGQIPENISGEKALDSDGDGLPDQWEKDYDTEICLFNFNSTDSDENGISDGLEDYDGDGYNSLEEYLREQNPCIKEKISKPNPIPGINATEKNILNETGKKIITNVETTTKSNILAWILLILGLFLLFLGLGYLIYDYNNQKSKPNLKTSRKEIESIVPSKERETSNPESFKDRLFGIRKKTEEKNKQRRRESAFAAFNSGSTTIPHVENIIQKKAPHLAKIQELAQQYTKHKEEIKPGLRPEEKSVFNRLEKITQKAKDKEIKEVVTPEEVKDIFSKLKDLSKKRKSGEK